MRERGPMTVAAFMDLALYDPKLGYYARAARRSGRAGDFFTSVDVGPLFGQLIEIQIAEMFQRLQTSDFRLQSFDLVEAGAGNGRLAADVLRAARERDPDLYGAVRLHLVEESAEARADQRETLGDVIDRLASSEATLPSSFEGVLVANELLDAIPVHQVIMREDGLREVYVTGLATGDWRLATIEGPVSTPRLTEYLEALAVRLEPGWRAEINLRAVEWIRDAARRLRRGFMILIDYGHEARELYSASHSSGTLTTFCGHRSEGADRPSPSWLQNPGRQDVTAHVDFTSVRAAAEAEGMRTIGFLDQTYFVMGLLPSLANPQSAIRNPQLKTLMLPGGLGSTHKVLILGKGVGTPALAGCSYRIRVT
ncbi:MAG TPA: SAM-dependent methyltransferase [Vicinamibacterales bacterium]|nr:SAM-dependent methyltransferase [Vicinamibacterales bacterium]